MLTRTPCRSRLFGQKGFTLVEMLIVIAIMGILAGVIVIPRMVTFAHSSSIAAATDEQQRVQMAVDAVIADAGVSEILGVPAPGWDGMIGNPGVQVTIGSRTYDAGNYLLRAPTKGTWVVAPDGIVTFGTYPGLEAADMP